MNIDLSTLPQPEVIETLSFEGILAEMKADLIERFPEVEAILQLESTLVAKVLQVAAYREILIRARINDAARALLLARAVGSDLDNKAADFGVKRLVITPATEAEPAVMEADDRLRRRVLLAIEAYSVAGPAGAYIYHAMTAAPELRDASAIQGSPGHVVVTLMASFDEPEPTTEQRQRVMLALSEKTVRPLTDVVSVSPPEVIEIDINAELMIYPGPDGSVVADRARAQLEQWLGEVGYLGRDLRRSAIFSRLHVDGVQSVALTSPAEDIIGGPRRAIKAGAINITIAGSEA
ncbi:baseplate assembly protein [Roseinatronobacter sp.]